MKVLTIGSATQDVIIEYQENALMLANPSRTTWQEGSKIEVKKLHRVSGGGATNSAASFTLLGFQTTACFKIGNDSTGQSVLKELADLSVTTHHSVSSSKETGASFIIPTPGKDRVIFAHHGANITLKKEDIPLESFGFYNCLYITSLSGKTADFLPTIAHTAQQRILSRGIKVAVNPGINQLTHNAVALKAALPSIDVLIMNADEMKLFMISLKPRFFRSTGKGIIPEGPELLNTTISYEKISFTLYEYFAEILSYGVKRIVVTDGKHGVYVATKDMLYFHPAAQVTSVNTLGAGDAFGSCFVASLLQGKKLEDAIRCGIINAGSVIMHHGAKVGLLSLSKLGQSLESLNKKLLQIFPI